MVIRFAHFWHCWNCCNKSKNDANFCVQIQWSLYCFLLYLEKPYYMIQRGKNPGAVKFWRFHWCRSSFCYSQFSKFDSYLCKIFRPIFSGQCSCQQRSLQPVGNIDTTTLLVQIGIYFYLMMKVHTLEEFHIYRLTAYFFLAFLKLKYVIFWINMWNNFFNWSDHYWDEIISWFYVGTYLDM